MTREGDSTQADKLRQLEHIAYPEALRCREEQLVANRHRKAGEKALERREPQVGLALSGGGIRSATFALGVLQAIAKRRALQQVDLLSTVSGGGYTGGMLTRLFSRKEVHGVHDVENAILAPWERREPDDPNAKTIEPGAVLAWLRENGHHLAPNGAGDLLLGGAVIFRNWLSVLVVLATLVLTGFVLMQLARHGVPFIDFAMPGCGGPVAAAATGFEAWLTCHLPLGGEYVWWSPWVALPFLVFVLWVAPCGLAYWLMPGTAGTRLAVAGRLFGVLVLLGASAWGLHVTGTPSAWAIGLVFGVALFAFIVYDIADHALRRKQCSEASKRLELSHRLSSWLKRALLAFAAVTALAVLDTLGQTLYTVAIDPDIRMGAVIGGALSAVAALAVGGRRLAVRFRGDGDPARPRLPLKVTASAVTALVLIATLAPLNALSHAIAWNLDYPAGVPADLWTSATVESRCPPVLRRCPDSAASDLVSCPVACPEVGKPALASAGIYFVLLALLSFVFGHARRFLNDSTLQPLYRARIIRAYLGASNPRRLDRRHPKPVTRMLHGDDAAVDWDRGSELAEDEENPLKKYDHGAPLHIVNVTVNETAEKKTGIQRNDRGGIGMAVGPAGISAGVRHHVVFHASADSNGLLAQVFPDAGDKHAFRMFDYADAAESSGQETTARYRGESLTLGQWIGISGAAFSTGVGSRTSFPLSFLAGILNVRLGYWWDSGIGRGSRLLPKLSKGDDQTADGSSSDGLASRTFATLFPVQSYLLDELFARFRGVHRPRWNLSDGGHFENLGAYELIRRRVPLIVIVDAEADPDYRFEGLGNLVRKARVDFGAKITFLDPQQVGRLASDNAWMTYYGSLDMLRRDARDNEAGAGVHGHTHATSSRDTGRSLAHVALATVCYEGGDADKTSLILYLKPTLVGDEPVDITHYHEANPAFPQQTTKDQFFDEAQWESYRKLGEIVGLRSIPESGGFESVRKLTRPLNQDPEA